MSYYKQNEAENAMAVVASWISKNPKIKVEYHNGNAVDADIFTGRIRIPRLACASGLQEEALMILRGQVYHEGKHIDSTHLAKAEYPKGALFSILNGLEDRRIEAEGSSEHLGCKMVFRWMNEYYNKRIAGQIASGKTNAPLWEAICAMSLVVDGVIPAWKLTHKAQIYFDTAYNEFSKVRTAKDTKACLELARKIYDLLKQTSDDLNNEQEKKEEKKDKGKQDKGKQDKQDKSEDGEDGESGDSSGAAGDMDDDSKEESNNSDENSDDSKDNDSKKSKKNSKSKGKDSGESEEDNEESKGSGKDSEEDNEEDSEEDNEEDSEEDNEEESEGSGKDSGSDLDKESENPYGSKDSGSDESGKGLEESDDAEADKADKDSDDGKEVAYKPNNTGKPVLAKSSLEDEVAGPSAAEIMNERLEEIFDEMPEVDKNYLACRDNDEHTIPPTTLADKSTFIDRRGRISSAVANMTHALAQSLRSLARCRKNPYLRQGKIDKKRLVQIAKSLSKEVFYKTKNGQELDVAVEIIVDESGSMGNFYEVQLLMIAIGESLTQIGVPFEITGTTTKGGYSNYNVVDFTRYNPIVYKHYKTFNEQWANVRQRIIYTGAHNNNVDGEAVEYAAFRLAQRKESRKVIFSLSDGEPCAGQGNDYEMCANLKRVCQRVRRAGIEVYGFGIGTQAPEAFYGKKYFVFLQDVASMGQDFVRKFVSVITGGRVRV
jgi:hypothetical protein